MEDQPTIQDVLAKVRERVQSRAVTNSAPPRRPISRMRQITRSSGNLELSALKRELHSCNMLHSAVGTINPRQPGLHNQAIQFFKKVMRRCLTWYTRPLHQFHGAVTRTLNEMAVAVERLSTGLAELEGQILELNNTFEQRARGLEAGIRRVESTAYSLTSNATPTGNMVANSSHEFDYRAFEDHFRGPQDVIRERQRSYLDIFRDHDDVLDIGCGRGEFLELLRDAGIRSRGIDSNAEMVELCRAKNLDVAQDDVFTTLEALPDSSIGGLFCSQVIEHLPPPLQLRLARVAYRKLSAGSAVVIETINPECVSALVHNYLLDPTHVRPVHPEMLKFVMESIGFSRVDIRYSSPVDDGRNIPELVLSNGDAPALERFNKSMAAVNSLLFGYQDYAVIGWR